MLEPRVLAQQLQRRGQVILHEGLNVRLALRLLLHQMEDVGGDFLDAVDLARNLFVVDGHVQRADLQNDFAVFVRFRVDGLFGGARLGGFRRGLAQLGLPRESVAVAGDQVYTDTLGGSWAGLRTFLVRSIDRAEPFIRLRWLFERPFVRRAKRYKGE